MGLDLLRDLEAGDILLIDSTHALKIGSDVNRHLIRGCRRCARGWSRASTTFSEHPEAWVLGGRAWTAASVSRAVLQHHAAFRIAFFDLWLARAHRGLLAEGMPLALRGPGSSLRLRRA